MFSIFGIDRRIKEIENLSGKLAELEVILAELEEGVASVQKSINKQIAKSEKNDAESKDLEKYLLRIMKRTGWDAKCAYEKYVTAKELTQCSPREYYINRFYRLNEEEQKGVFLSSMQKILRKKYSLEKAFAEIIRNLASKYSFFSEYVHRAWCVNTEVTLDEFQKKFETAEKVVYIPEKESSDCVPALFDLHKDGLSVVFDKLQRYPKGIVEELVTQQKEMKLLFSDSMNIIRLVTFSSNGRPVTEDGKMADIAYATLHIGDKDNIVSDFVSSGIIANVDLKTGVVLTDAVNKNGRVFTHHPETDAKIKGMVVPCFSEACEMVMEAIGKKKIQGYLGWDITISETGPELIDICANPNAQGLQLAYAQEGKGMKHIMDKYLWDDIK